MLDAPDSDANEDPEDLDLRGIHVSPAPPGLPAESGLGALLAVVLVVAFGALAWVLRRVRLRRRSKRDESAS